ncbi:MAG: protein translocase subunit SecD [Candidatus Rhabdochlamydia sp.]
MEKPKRWHFFLIISVFTLTLYNILPTLFFYTKPLKDPIQEKEGYQIARQIALRVNALEQEAIDFTLSFAKLIDVSPLSIEIDPTNCQLLTIKFHHLEEAKRFRYLFTQSQNYRHFAPSKLEICDLDFTSKSVTLQRKIPLHFNLKNIKSYFTYGKIKEEDGTFTPLYQDLIHDRLKTVMLSLGGASSSSLLIQSSFKLQDASHQDTLMAIGKKLLENAKLLEKHPSLRKRYFASFSQNPSLRGKEFVTKWLSAFDKIKEGMRLQRIELRSENQEDLSQERKEQTIQELLQQENMVLEITALIRKYKDEFAAGKNPLNSESIQAPLQNLGTVVHQTFSLKGCHPFIESVTVNGESLQFELNLYADIIKAEEFSPLVAKEGLLQIISDNLFLCTQAAEEALEPLMGSYRIPLDHLSHAQSFLLMDLELIGQAASESIKSTLESYWTPTHPDLKRDVFPIKESTSSSEKTWGLFISPPTFNARTNSYQPLYIHAKGLNIILKQGEKSENSLLQQELSHDLQALQHLLKQQGFTLYSVDKESVVFKSDIASFDLLQATREEWHVQGSKRYAVLEFSNIEQRILTENRIDDQIHEELLKWKDDYHAASAGVKNISPFAIPKPTQSAFLSNLKLSFIKYFRGDNRKILQWGLDLSGGKTLQIELQDRHGKQVANEESLKQGMHELYSRVNKMGISEVSIRQEGKHLAVDFPGSHALSAKELVRASSMFFHIVNEKFMTNPSLRQTSDTFLKEVWQEAITAGKKELSDIQLIAWNRLHGKQEDIPFLRTEASQTLYDAGLRLAYPFEEESSSLFDTSLSKIALFKETAYQAHPLTLIFAHYALEGAHLDHIEASYDASKGNILSFTVKKTALSNDKTLFSPQEDLYTWSSAFCEEKIKGTPLEKESNGRGWKMAVILNGHVIAEPSLSSPIKESASLTGNFTQREIRQLELDLKAGSLSFTPKILSENNVSPELGKQERNTAILGMITSLVLAASAMIITYRFAGVIASFAVIFNLLIIGAALQNIGATLTLSGIVGVILTVAMSVDASVLVFERIREEQEKTGHILKALQLGYQKALSAIIDSNMTMLIAAVILFQFDAGPVKGLAITLIIGIISSLFTSLFFTRVFFTYWFQNPQRAPLHLRKLILPKEWNFLKFTRIVVGISACVILLGSYLFFKHEQSLLGMDFKGGYALTIDIAPSQDQNTQLKVEEAFLKSGLSAKEFQVRQLQEPHSLRLFFSKSLDEPGKPFNTLSDSLNANGLLFESNAKIVWIVESLEASGVTLSSHSLEHLEENWTAISGQMSQTMKIQAVLGMSLSLLAILLYITIRFEWKYALSATLCLIYDVIFCLSSMAILHQMKVPLQLDFHTVAALMTIIGYSLNDTIIVFDRIREDFFASKGQNFHKLINEALNVTLSRTLMTSGITLLVLLPLLFLGGSTLFGFALVMVIGVVFGTLSSLFVAAPLMGWFHQYRLNK